MPQLDDPAAGDRPASWYEEPMTDCLICGRMLKGYGPQICDECERGDGDEAKE